MPQHYPIPARAVEVESEVKKSRFIARAAPCPDREHAMALLEQARRDYPDARHHCWAYQLGDPASPHSAAMSDDGEPSGTAGKPILNVLSHADLGDVMVIVIRYFGGIKLGAGGLVRAYSHAASQALDALPRMQREPTIRARVACDFSLEQPLRHWLAGHQGQVLNVDYQHQVELEVELPERCRAAWIAWCRQHQLSPAVTNA